MAVYGITVMGSKWAVIGQLLLEHGQDAQKRNRKELHLSFWLLSHGIKSLNGIAIVVHEYWTHAERL